MRVTTKGRYAVRAILYLAVNCHDDPIPIRKIAEAEGISPEFLEQIFFRLKNSGIIRSVRGPGGGFAINKPLAKISVRDIFESVGEGMDLTPCTACNPDEDEVVCERKAVCQVYDLWNAVSKKITDNLTAMTLDKIIDKKFD
jgi:Rrf2 family transcriptional regulator, iron-sulfur cluster assembly transcription factor